MKILITGGNGYLGGKLADALLERDTFPGPEDNEDPIDEIIYCDIVPRNRPAATTNERVKLTDKIGDISDPRFVYSVLTKDIDVVYHLASLVSAGAEQDFEKGLQANFFGTVNLLEQCRSNETIPRFIFTSSVAAYGGDLPAVVTDYQLLNPQTSYGVHKVIGEQLVNDYSRKGYVDGRSIRLPIIIVRPGKPNTAASGWASSIVREPLQGLPFVCPLQGSDTGFVLSANQVTRSLVHAGVIDGRDFGCDRAVMLPGLTCTVNDIVSALKNVAGEKAVNLISWREDQFIRRIINGWPSTFNTARAEMLGFAADKNLEGIIEDFIAEELSDPQ